MAHDGILNLINEPSGGDAEEIHASAYICTLPAKFAHDVHAD